MTNMQIHYKWPEVLAEIIYVFDAALKADNDPDHEIKAQNMVKALSNHMGGRQIYIPKASDLAATLKAEAIYKEFNGNNITFLCQKYDLSEPRIYQIIQTHRALARQRNQLKLV